MPAWKWPGDDTRGSVKLEELIRRLNVRMPKLSAIIDQLFYATQTVGTFTNGDTSPSVYGGSLWKTNNAAGTLITRFDDGLAGQDIIVWATDANTTLQHSAALYLKGGVNVTLGANEARRFATADGANWREV